MATGTAARLRKVVGHPLMALQALRAVRRGRRVRGMAILAALVAWKRVRCRKVLMARVARGRIRRVRLVTRFAVRVHGPPLARGRRDRAMTGRARGERIGRGRVLVVAGAAAVAGALDFLGLLRVAAVASGRLRGAVRRVAAAALLVRLWAPGRHCHRLLGVTAVAARRRRCRGRVRIGVA